MIRVCIIAEHDPWEIRLLTVYADRLGLQTIQAFESQDVLPLAHQEQPDVILLESSLPGALKSHEVLRALQSDDTTRDIPVVLLAWSPEEARRERPVYDAGYLQKPVTYEAFVAALAEAGVSPAQRAGTGGG